MTIKPAKNTILDISPYVGGRSKLADGRRSIKLSSNENPFGPSPMAVEAMQSRLNETHRYPDGTAMYLRETIAWRFSLKTEKIVCGAGSDEIISLICQAYLAPGDEIIYSEHGFLMYPIYARVAGATPVAAPEENLCANVDNILAKVSDKTRIVFIANPNNPTGSYVTQGELARLRAELPNRVLLVLDLAYAEYVQADDYPNAIEMVQAHDNVVMLRTFSKIYGLASLRLGWGYANEAIIDVLNRVRGPFNVSDIAQYAGAAALKDTDYEEQAREHNNRWLEKLSEAFSALGLIPYPSVGNFLLVGFPADNDKDAAAADAYLQDSGIIVRRMEGYGLPSCLRISIGTDEENEALITTLKDFFSY